LDVYVNLRRTGQSILLAACDAEILGKTLKRGKLTFHIVEKFYKGTLVSVEEATDLIRKSAIVNLVGPRIVGAAVRSGCVHPDAVIEIEGVPHAQIVKL
jgi:hypothetical protein